MLFNSIEFVVFFLMLTAAFYAAQHRWRWPLLLVASCYFYMVFVPEYLLILFFLILIDYTAGLCLEASEGITRKAVLLISLAANLGLLGVFKYFNFAEEQVLHLLHWVGQTPSWVRLNLILPIGLSFHTFQSMSYTIEVYLRRQKAERHLGIYALYVLFFAQMVAGPIERPQNLLHQFRRKIQFDPDNVASGLRLMLWGFFKKMVIADNLARIVDTVYAAPTTFGRGALIVSTYAFALQIYTDFSGYSDIARGAARVLGYELMLNFNLPYHSRSISEFWRRWHISLSTWFRDYVYVPLGGNRAGALRTSFNLCVVFLLSGLWHGASWAYVLWGGLHGVYLTVGRLTRDVRAKWSHGIGLSRFPRIQQGIAIFITFHLVLVSWVLFRAGGMRTAVQVFSSIWHAHPGRSLPWGTWPLDRFHLWGVVGALIILESVQLMQRQAVGPNWADRIPVLLRRTGYGLVLVAILLWGRLDAHNFIYFQF